MFRNLYSWNALLPSDQDEDGILKYRVRISDIEFEKLTSITTEAQCNKCEVCTEYNKIRIFDLTIPLLVQVITNQTTNKVWICPSCKNDNLISETNILERHLQEPYFLGVIPKPPQRKEGLQDRGKYDRKVENWASNFIVELEQKSTQFREDYKTNKAEIGEFDADEVDFE